MTMRIALAFAASLLSVSPCQAFDEIKDCDVCPAMVVLPEGQFVMGSNSKEGSLPDEKPAHPVTIAKAFAVGKFEVTFAQWDACAADGACNRVRRKLGTRRSTSDQRRLRRGKGLCIVAVEEIGKALSPAFGIGVGVCRPGWHRYRVVLGHH